MPRQAATAASQPNLPQLAPALETPLSGHALDFFNQVSARWELDIVSAKLLHSVCVFLEQASRAAEITAREGLTCKTSQGIGKHPASLIERDARAAAIAGLAKLKLDLE